MAPYNQAVFWLAAHNRMVIRELPLCYGALNHDELPAWWNEHSMYCVYWTRWKSSVAVTNGTRLACSTGWVTCGFERKLCLLALPRVHLMKEHLQQRLYPRTWH